MSQEINLLPDYYVKQRHRDRIDLICVVVFGLLMGGMIVGNHFLREKYDSLHNQSQEVSRRFEQESQWMRRYYDLQRDRSEMLKKAKLGSAVQERMSRSYLLAMLADARPKELSVTELSLMAREPVPESEKPGVKRTRSDRTPRKNPEPTPPPEPLVRINVNGLAENDRDVAAFYSSLKGHPLVETIELSYTREVQKDRDYFREFEIVMVMKRGMDVRELLRERQVSLAGDSRRQEGGRP
jgi:hypothetical protein